jgi:hypothetical protein
MSFICKVCGPVGSGLKQFKIPTKIRDVVYSLQVRTIYADGESTRIVRSVKGSEIAEEISYCKEHLPVNTIPEKIGKVTRNQLIKTVLVKRDNKDEEEEK